MAIDKTVDNAAAVLDSEAGRRGLWAVPNVRGARGRYTSSRVSRCYFDITSNNCAHFCRRSAHCHLSVQVVHLPIPFLSCMSTAVPQLFLSAAPGESQSTSPLLGQLGDVMPWGCAGVTSQLVLSITPLNGCGPWPGDIRRPNCLKWLILINVKGQWLDAKGAKSSVSSLDKMHLLLEHHYHQLSVSFSRNIFFTYFTLMISVKGKTQNKNCFSNV